METIAASDRFAADHQVQLLARLRELGYPVPPVRHEAGRAIVQPVAGATMLGELLREPAQVERYGRLLGELHARLHRIPAPDWLPEVSAGGTARHHLRDAIDGERRVVLHLDLQPANVVLGMAGPVVVRWADAAAGPAELDVALTVLAVLGPDLHMPDAPQAQRERLDASRGLLIEAFLAACGAGPTAGMADAIAYRLADPELSDGERGWLREAAPSCLDRFAY